MGTLYKRVLLRVFTATPPPPAAAEAPDKSAAAAGGGGGATRADARNAANYPLLLY